MTNYGGWDWVVRSYNRGKLMLETTHRGEFSRDMEIEAAKKCGYEVQIFKVKDGTAWPWQQFSLSVPKEPEMILVPKKEWEDAMELKKWLDALWRNGNKLYVQEAKENGALHEIRRRAR